jgi:hypothetical protein
MFSWLSDAFFLVCANLWIGIEKNIKIHHAPNWCFNACFFAILQGNKHNL